MANDVKNGQFEKSIGMCVCVCACVCVCVCVCVETDYIGTDNISSVTSSHGIYLRFILVLSSHPRYTSQAIPSLL